MQSDMWPDASLTAECHSRLAATGSNYWAAVHANQILNLKDGLMKQPFAHLCLFCTQIVLSVVVVSKSGVGVT
jgi:hypothetical protein